MKRFKLIFDVDGVLADFTSRVMSLVNAECGTHFTPKDVKTWEIFDSLQVEAGTKDVIYDIMRGPGGCANIKPYPDAVEWFGEVRKVADVIIATCPLSGSRWWTFEREEWLKRHFGIEKELVHHVHDKRRIHGDALVDDNPKHLEAWIQYWSALPIREDGTPFTIHWTGNGTSLPPDLKASFRCGKWHELLEIIA